MTLFSENLRKRAKELGISNAEVARRAGLGERRYANYINGDREPDLGTLVKIAKVLGTSPNALLGFGEQSGDQDVSSARDRILAALAILDEPLVDAVALQIEALTKLGRQSAVRGDEL